MALDKDSVKLGISILKKINKIRLTKKRAWVLRDMIKRLEDYVPEENSPRFNDYCATLEWMRQEINKRYSEFDLGTI